MDQPIQGTGLMGDLLDKAQRLRNPTEHGLDVMQASLLRIPRTTNESSRSPLISLAILLVHENIGDYPNHNEQEEYQQHEHSFL